VEGSENQRDERAGTPRPLEYESNPPRKSDGPTPVLSYQDIAGQKADRPRTRSFRIGVLGVWVSCGVCIPMLFTTGNTGWLQALGGSAIMLLAVGVAKTVTERNAKFLLGVLAGAITAVGAAALAVVIICGTR
jgi:hypothetical protein